MERRFGSPGGRAANLIPLDAGEKAKTLAMLCERFASFGGRDPGKIRIRELINELPLLKSEPYG
jgi:hypothetical protein